LAVVAADEPRADPEIRPAHDVRGLEISWNAEDDVPRLAEIQRSVVDALDLPPAVAVPILPGQVGIARLRGLRVGPALVFELTLRGGGAKHAEIAPVPRKQQVSASGQGRLDDSRSLRSNVGFELLGTRRRLFPNPQRGLDHPVVPSH